MLVIVFLYVLKFLIPVAAASFCRCVCCKERFWTSSQGVFGCLTEELMVRGEDEEELGGVRDDPSRKRGSVIGIGQGGFLFGI